MSSSWILGDPGTLRSANKPLTPVRRSATPGITCVERSPLGDLLGGRMASGRSCAGSRTAGDREAACVAARGGLLEGSIGKRKAEAAGDGWYCNLFVVDTSWINVCGSLSRCDLVPFGDEKILGPISPRSLVITEEDA